MTYQLSSLAVPSKSLRPSAVMLGDRVRGLVIQAGRYRACGPQLIGWFYAPEIMLPGGKYPLWLQGAVHYAPLPQW